MSEPRTRPTQLQGSWRETGSALRGSRFTIAPKKFREPVALSSTEPADFPLSRTALELGFDLIALRALCMEEPNAVVRSEQERAERRFCKLRELLVGVVEAVGRP